MRVNFLILGSQKGGSTWLYNTIRQHPQVNTPKHELHYFSSDENFQKGVGWYHSHFNGTGESKIYGEKTPEYLTVIPTKNKKTSTVACKRIYDYNSNIKLLVVLREPVARLRSAINHMYRTRRIAPWVTAHDLVLGGKKNAADEFSLLENGLYYENLVEYYKVFPKSQLKILFFETDILENPEKTMEGVCDFLEVPFNSAYFPSLGEKQNEYQMSLPALALNYLLPFMRPINNRLNHIFPAYRTNIDPETKNFLQRYYGPSNKRLSGLVGQLPRSWNYDPGPSR
jgi:hypothetical protein